VTEDLNKVATPSEERIQSLVLWLLAPSLIGLVLSFLSESGTVWGLLAGLGNALAALGIFGAVALTLIAAALRKIGFWVVGVVFVEAGIAALVFWIATKVARNPFG
jgi:hypothetical protein